MELPNSLDNAIKNLTNEPSKGIGTTLNDIWYLVFGFVSHAADKKRLKYANDLESYYSELSTSISHIPPERKIEPSFQTTAQALENSKYCISEKELRQLFTNLISGTMDSSVSPYIHPSFAEIIKQMSPTDAKLLQKFPLKSFVAVADYIKTNTETSNYSIELSNVCFPNDFDIFQACNSLSSLNRLGLVALETESHLSDENAYNDFFQTDFFKYFSKEVCSNRLNQKADIRKYVAKLTPLGQNFVYSCVISRK